MDILTYPVGLLIGLVPVVVDPGNGLDPAHLLLDGRPVCEMSVPATACTVDLGPDPVIHLLELVLTDQAGRITSRVSRWINRPGVEAEVRTNGSCQETTRTCSFAVTWAHPAKADPVSLTLSLDGETVWRSVTPTVSVRFPHSLPPQVVSTEATFPDGSRARFTRLLRGSYPEKTEASLQAVPIEVDTASTPAEFAEALRGANSNIEAVEQKDFEVIFVVEPGALERLPSLGRAAVGNSELYGGALLDAERIRVLVPNERIMSFEGLPKVQDAAPPASRFAPSRPINRPSWVRRLILAPQEVGSIRRLRTADAVAVAGYALASSPRRRLLVLIAGGGQEDQSVFSPSQAQAYLSQTLVPLVVWRIGDAAAPGWPDGPVLRSPSDFATGVAKLGHMLERQHVVWIRGRVDPRFVHPTFPPDTHLAGRITQGVADSGAAPRQPQTQVKAIGPDGGAVYALAAEGEAVLYAATDGGVFRSEDGGRHWLWASDGLGDTHVRALAVDRSSPGRVYAGTDAGLFLSPDGATSWTRSGPALSGKWITAIGIDPSRPDTVYAGTKGAGLWRSTDRAEHWTLVLPDRGIEAIVVAPSASHAILVAAEGRLLRADDRFQWSDSSPSSGRIRALLLDPGRPELLYAGTDDDGLLRSDDGGKTWKPTSLRSTLITSLLKDAAQASRIYATGLDGVFSSADEGASWRLERIGAVLGLAATGGERRSLVAATARGILRREPGSTRWNEANDGLSASHVYALAADPEVPGSMDAGTAGGLRRTTDGGAHWMTPLAGSPETPVYALAVAPSRMLFGASGALGSGREENGWTLVPTHGAFGLAADPFDPDTFLAATAAGVVRSTDGGLHWSKASGGFSKTIPLSLSADPKHQGVFYAGTADSGVFKTTDSGKQWKKAGGEIERAVVRCLAVDPSQADTIYAGTDGGVFVSANGGRGWSFRSTGSSRASVYSLAVDPTDGGTVYAGTDQGLFQSFDAGKTWSRAPGPLALPAITGIAVDRTQRRLVLGTLGGGVRLVALPPAPSSRTPN